MFQRAIEMLLTKLMYKYALVYLDDVIILSPEVQSHFMNVVTVLQMLLLAGLCLKLRISFSSTRQWITGVTSYTRAS